MGVEPDAELSSEIIASSLGLEQERIELAKAMARCSDVGSCKLVACEQEGGLGDVRLQNDNFGFDAGSQPCSHWDDTGTVGLAIAIVPSRSLQLLACPLVLGLTLGPANETGRR